MARAKAAGMMALSASMVSGMQRSDGQPFPASVDHPTDHPTGRVSSRATALLVVLLVAGVACGGKAKPDATATSPDGQKHQKQEMGQMTEMSQKHEPGEVANMRPEIAKFHDTLAPRWHAEPGQQRMADTCAAIAQFRADADAIAASQAPSGGDAAAWSAGGKQLTEAVAALEKICQAKDAAAFEPAFERVHTAFHGLMAASGHGEHGKHGHGEHGKHGKHEHGEHEHGEHKK
jgi:cytochrome c556